MEDHALTADSFTVRIVSGWIGLGRVGSGRVTENGPRDNSVLDA